MNKSENLVIIYIYLAVASGISGVILVFALLFATQYFEVDISKHWWVLAIPVTLAVTLNIIFIELYLRHRRK